MTEDEALVADAVRLTQQLLNRALKTGRYSPGFLFELVQQLLDGRNVETVVEEIRHLEDPVLRTKTRKARQFKNGILKDIWYKHYFQVQFLPKNLCAELRKGW